MSETVNKNRDKQRAQKVQITFYDEELAALRAEAERLDSTVQRVAGDYAIAYLRHLTAIRTGEAVGSPLLDRLEMLERTMAAEHDAILADASATHTTLVQLSDFVDLAVQAVLLRLPSVPAEALQGARAAMAESYTGVLDAMLKKKNRLPETLARRALSISPMASLADKPPLSCVSTRVSTTTDKETD